MLEILQFIFGSFWRWAGSAVLLLIVTEGAMRSIMAMAEAFASRDR